MTQPRVFIVSGPSGVGKSSIIHGVLDRREDVRLSVSTTTRETREEEEEGRDYYFVDKAEFERMIARDWFLEWARSYGNYYGTGRTQIEDILSQGCHALLDIDTQYDNVTAPRLHEGLCGPPGCRVLEGVLRNRGQIVDLGGNCLSSTEALLLGLPGPARAKTSFGAGLRFSPSRKRMLHTLHDEKGTTKQRLVGQPVDFTDAAHLQALPASPSAWMTFVARRWKNGDCARLAIETSRPFEDVGAEARERIGGLYNDIDAIPEMATDALLAISLERLRNVGNGVEQNITTEFLAEAGRTLAIKFGNASWTELAPHWQSLVATWRCANGQPAFVQPLLAAMLRAAMRDDPMLAAERALVLAQDVPSTVDAPTHTALLDEVLNRLAAWVRSNPNADTRSVLALCDRWTSARRRCPILDLVRQNCTADVGLP